MLNADTITDAQISALLDDDDVVAYLAASQALGVGSTSEPLSAREMADGRARCAEILNARQERHVKITAASITDAQIRALLATIPHEGGINVARREACHVALGEAPAQKTRLAAFPLTREDARARCAEILNARAKRGVG